MRKLLIVVCLFGILPAYAQTVVKGKVIDALTKEPLQGASISFGSKGGTTTDADGAFSFECGKTKKITISFVGYHTEAYSIKNCNDEIIIALHTYGGEDLDKVEITATSNPN